jgi:hypothetical protein
VALSTELKSEPGSSEPRTAGASDLKRLIADLWRAASICAVFLFSAATVIVVAFAAPLALGVSAAARAAAPARRRGRWRLAQPA